jgi:hypothetical protein
MAHQGRLCSPMGTIYLRENMHNMTRYHFSLIHYAHLPENPER